MAHKSAGAAGPGLRFPPHSARAGGVNTRPSRRLACTFFVVRGTTKIQLLASKKLIASEQDMPASLDSDRYKMAPTALTPVIGELFAKSMSAEFEVTADKFVAILREVAAKHAGTLGFEQFCGSLRIEDLVLARACASGNERAWQVFMARFREKLYDVARQITREDSSGRELADSVYADLYGMKTREGVRTSKLASYSGRGSLDGWLRTVVAQEFVNTYRKQRRLVSLDEESEEGVQFAAATQEDSPPPDPQLARAADEALRALDAAGRFVLASYFLDGRTLAEIAGALSVHESTISRKVEKLTKSLRKQILKNLVRYGMSRRQAEEALTVDVRDLALDISASLAQDSVAGAFSEKGAKAGEGGS
jgi:RNA polymerase sigma-70 factor, ECF subfamily